jgi:GNAT superfamily N-acetyltransferase
VSEIVCDLRLRTFGIWGIDLTGAGLEVKRGAIAEIMIGQAAVEEIDRACQIRTHLRRLFFNGWLQETGVCFLAKVGSQVAAVGWLVDHHQFSTVFRLAERDGVIRSLFTLPEFRNRGVAKEIIGSICRWADQHGYERLFAGIDLKNTHSEKAFGAVGFDKRCQLNRFGLLGPRYVPRLHRRE